MLMNIMTFHAKRIHHCSVVFLILGVRLLLVNLHAM